jgi:Rrf2 family protein
MQLNTTTDYAIRVLLCLETSDRPLVAAELSSRAKVPQTYLVSIMSKLRHAGLIASKRGQIGGYTLAKPSNEITLWDIVAAMERTPQLMCCMAAGYDCAFSSLEQCPLRGELCAVQKGLEDVFRSITLEKLGKRMPKTGEE